MATIKSFTDLSQSKVLNEILKPESADILIGNYVGKSGEVDGTNIHYYNKGESFSAPEIINAWSLAALLNILPPYLFEFERGIDLNVYPNLNGNRWHCSYMPNCIENMKTDKFRLVISKDNLVDACYETILKLHELKML